MTIPHPPPGLSDAELAMWYAEMEIDDGPPKTFELPLTSGVPVVDLGKLHIVFPPGIGSATDEYIRLYPFFWYSCQHPDRAVDEAMLLDENCPRCKAEWDRRGLPISPLPPLPGDAPRLRDY